MEMRETFLEKFNFVLIQTGSIAKSRPSNGDGSLLFSFILVLGLGLAGMREDVYMKISIRKF